MKSRYYQRGGLFVLLVLGLVACQEDDFDLGDMPSSIFGEGSGDVYQAEDLSSSSGCSERTNHTGYTGSGFMDYGGNGTWIEWRDVDVAAAGDYDLTFRYANARSSGRQSAAIVNGQNIGNVGFGGTGAWTTWGTDAITVSLREGLNTIRIQANTGSGGPNLDAMEVSVNDLCLDDPNKTEPGDCGCGVPEGSCSGAGNGLTGTYFNNMDFTSQVFERVDPTVDFNWGTGSPHVDIDSNTFSVRWTGFVEAKYSETYTFYTNSDDGIRLWVDGKLVIENWTIHPPTENQGTVSLRAGERYEIKLDYYENGGGAVAKLLWSSSTQAKQIVPESSLFTDNATGQTLCVEVAERQSATLTCPAGETITRIDFASYGLPIGSCDTGFERGNCHAASSTSEVEALCLNQQSCTVAASNGVFGDPCAGKFKKLAVVYACGGDGDLGQAWAKCLQMYGAHTVESESGGIVRDHFGRNIDSSGLLLVDWEGPMGNPETKFQIAAPQDMQLPLKMFVSVPDAPLLYLDAWSGTHDAHGPRTTKAIEYFNAGDVKTFGIGVNPDRDFESETYALQVVFTSRDGTSKTVEVPIHICDQDQPRPLEFKFTRKYLDVYGDGWLQGGGSAWDYNEDGVHDGVQSKTLMDQIIDDVAYYIAPWDVDTVPVGGADSHVIWDGENAVLPVRQRNTEPFDDFYLFVSLGNSATGLPGFTRHTRNGEPTDLANCGVVHIDRQLPLEWRETNHVDGWHFHDGVSEDWWRSSKWNEGPSPTGDCPEGQSECRYYASSFYSIMKHELLHTLAYEGGWPRWKGFEAAGCIDDEAVMAYTGQCTPVYGVHAWDPQLHLRAWNNGIELIDKFEILVLQAVGWRLRDTTPFVDLEAVPTEWPTGDVGRKYEASLPIRGGVPAYRFVVTGGELPPGLTLDSFSGKLSGIPLSAGNYRFDVEVTDSGLGTGISIPLEIVIDSNTNTGMPVFLLAGQSNMEGHFSEDLFSELLSELESGPQGTLQQRLEDRLTNWYESYNNGYAMYGYSQQMVALEAQELIRLNASGLVDTDLTTPYSKVWCAMNDTDVQPLETNCGMPFGPELVLGHALGATAHSPTSLIKVAKGGSTLNVDWLSPTAAAQTNGSQGEWYTSLRQRIESLDSDPASVHPECADQQCQWGAFVWFQGENDCFDEQNAQAYEQNLTNLIADVRAEIGSPALPVIVVQIGAWARSMRFGNVVAAAQQTVVEADPHAELVVTDDLSGFYHYDPAAQLIIGERVARVLVAMLK